MVLVGFIVLALVVTFGLFKLADHVFLDKPKPRHEHLKYDPLCKDCDAPQDLRYDPLAVDEDVCTFRQARPPSKCLVCGDPMKQEGIVETCDCCQRGYQPRS